MKLNRYHAVLSLCTLLSFIYPAHASPNIGIGVGLSSPAGGVVFTSRINNTYGVKLVTGFVSDISVQAEIFHKQNPSTYWFVGVGRDSLADLAKAGIGIERNYQSIKLFGELGLSLPHSRGDKLGLAAVGYIVALGVGVRYEF